jgi:hypothetical protein
MSCYIANSSTEQALKQLRKLDEPSTRRFDRKCQYRNHRSAARRQYEAQSDQTTPTAPPEVIPSERKIEVGDHSTRPHR